MPREGRFDSDADFRLFLNWARDKITNWEGENWVSQDSLDLIEEELDSLFEMLTEHERDGFPGDPAKSYEIFDRLRDCARIPADFSWGVWRPEEAAIPLRDDNGNWVGYAKSELTSTQLLRGAGIIQHRYSSVPAPLELNLVGFEQDGVKGYMGHATAGALDAVCSVPWMDPTLSSADFSNKLLNGQLDENKWQRVVNHDRIEDIRNFANTPGKNLFNPVLLYVDKNKIDEIKPLNGTGLISVPFDFLKERKGEFHDYLPFPHETDLRPIWIIDGQHRIRGFGSSSRGCDLPIPFVLLVGNGTPEDAARSALIFTEINTKSDPLDDLHKIYLNYQFAMEGSSQKFDFSVQKDSDGTRILDKDGVPLPTASSRPQRRAFEMALTLAADTDSPLHDCIEFQKPPGQKRKNHLVVNSKNFIDLTSKWFRGSNSIYGDWNTDDFAQKEVQNFFVAFKNLCNQWDDGGRRWETGQGKNKQLLQFEGPFLALMNIAEFSISTLVEKGHTERPFSSDLFETLLDPLMWVDWKSNSLSKSKLRGRTNQNIKHLTLWMTTAIQNAIQYSSDETLDSELLSKAGRGLLAAPDVCQPVKMSENSWPALATLDFKVDTPIHALKVWWGVQAWDGKRWRELDLPKDAITHPKINILKGAQTVENKLSIASNILPQNCTKLQVKAYFSNAQNTSSSDWISFEKPSNN